MKLLLLALVALASAEPESLWYQNQFTGYPVVSSALSYSQLASPYVYNNAYQFGSYPYVTRLNKREAEAEANHHLSMVYGQYPALYNTYATVAAAGEPVYKNGNFHTNLRNVQNGVHSQYTSGFGQIYQPLYQRLAKREAEAEADPLLVGYQPYAGAVAQYQYPLANYYSNRAYTYQPYTYPTSPVFRTLGKREAEAEPLYSYYTSSLYPTVRSTYNPVVASSVFSPYRANYVSSPYSTYSTGLYL